MAQINYRGNLSAKVFPFLSTQFGASVIVNGADQAAANTSGDSAGGDQNSPQAYYMHNVMPTGQGYKSVGFTTIVPPVGVAFFKVIPVRDPNMIRGWLGVTEQGKIYIYRAGDLAWTDISDQANWSGGNISAAYANGSTYICLKGKGVFKVNVTSKTITDTPLAGLNTSGIVAITNGANYLIVTDGITVYWSSTITPEDFIPSLVTGAGSGKPNDVKGIIVALAPINGGFIIYSSVNAVVAQYSQNPRFPWIFKGASNSKGVASIHHVAYDDDSDTNYVWTSGGLQKINVTGAVITMPEVTDFLAGKEIEDFNSETNELFSEYLDSPLNVKLAFIAARFLVVSYGVKTPTHALVYDTALKRWGKLRYAHVSCFEITLNTDKVNSTSNSASAKRTLGIVTSNGEVIVCDFDNGKIANDSVLVLGKYQLTRSRTTTLDKISLESVDNTTNLNVVLNTTLDGKNVVMSKTLTASKVTPKYREYPTRVTGANHTLIVKGSFHLNSIELAMHVNGRR